MLNISFSNKLDKGSKINELRGYFHDTVSTSFDSFPLD